ncbi:hypothetical protein ES703_35158 [subsurface metagenome]
MSPKGTLCPAIHFSVSPKNVAKLKLIFAATKIISTIKTMSKTQAANFVDFPSVR